jgi:hypothetical protein
MGMSGLWSRVWKRFWTRLSSRLSSGILGPLLQKQRWEDGRETAWWEVWKPLPGETQTAELAKREEDRHEEPGKRD